MTTITLSIFSGRPDPVIILDENASQEVSGLINSLPPIHLLSIDIPSLGYRGVVVDLDGEHIRVFSGAVFSIHRTAADSGRVVEKDLIERFRVIEPDVVDGILKTLA